MNTSDIIPIRYAGARAATFAPLLLLDIRPGGTPTDRTRGYLRPAAGFDIQSVEVEGAGPLADLVTQAAYAHADRANPDEAAQWLAQLALAIAGGRR